MIYLLNKLTKLQSSATFFVVDADKTRYIMKDKFYITTPIYYPSGKWHIGTCYTTVVCDAIARYYRLAGRDVFFLTGTDEHGQKIQAKAKENGVTPKEFVDVIVADLKEIWKMLDISYDRFIRTTDPDHVQTVQYVFKRLYENGDIYKSRYEGWYCTDCESFFTDLQLKDGKCPDCGREVHKEIEECYYFRLSKYADRILKLYEDNPEFLQPKSRMNEMINNFIKPGLQDLCVSRTSVKWGIPVEFDPEHTVYVWIDALSNYISALGYKNGGDEKLFEKFWPCDLHMTGKEIIRFHAIIWPAILMALDLPLPKKVYGHGWLLIGGDKLSKSKQDKISTELTDPKEIVARYGKDALRYFLMREIPFGSDGTYSNESFLNRINSDLSNDLGNLVSRTTAMISQNFDGVLPAPSQKEVIDDEIIALSESLFDDVNKDIEEINVPKALQDIFKLVSRANKYIDETTPWVLAKDPSKKERLGTVLYNLSECIRISATFLLPFIPSSAEKILNLYGIDTNGVSLDTAKGFGYLKPNVTVTKAQPIFPRIDVKKELKDIDDMMIKRYKEKEKAKKEETTADKKAGADKKAETESKDKTDAENGTITIDEFFKTELKVAKVVECEKVEKSDKLLKLKLSLGNEFRQVVSGIAAYYTPEEMIGKKVVLVANLKPAKLRGVLSEGMILCGESDGKVKLIEPDACLKEGSKIS